MTELAAPPRILDADAHVIEAAGVFDEWMEPGKLPAELPDTTPMIPCGDATLLEDQFAHGFDAPSYLRAMDNQGIDAVVLYPSLGLFVPFLPGLDAAASAAACRSYNEWIAGYTAHDRTRLAGVGLVPMIDPGLAAAEARWCADHDLVAVLVRPNFMYGRNLGDAAYDPLYAAVADAGIVLSVHEGLGLGGHPTIGMDRFDSFVERHAMSHPMEQMAAMASLFLSGTLDRHPTLRVAFLESGTGWLPFWLHRLDEHVEWMEDSETKGLERTPSQYFADQCTICTDPDDALVGLAAAQVGADHLMWASDFPHPDALYPNAVDAFLREAAHDDGARVPLTPRDLEQILWTTPARFYRVEERFIISPKP
ncbi:MAG TPA: amidohydrolase family protein [Acidimicrobiia bacterium]|nr:amidohydrolase family protein [Acidimicrobiia bacterium]